MNILNIENLTIKNKQSKIIVDNISFSIKEGQWLALVGESGSGKSVTASSIGRLLPNDLEITSGQIYFNNKNMMNISKSELQKCRGKDVSYIFQDYQNTFTPSIKLGKQINEVLKCHTTLSKMERLSLISKTIEDVGLPSKKVMNSYSFQLSGGQLQRVAIAQAIILKPKLLIADEATTALDAVTTHNILTLLNSIRTKDHCALLFITHDLRCALKYAESIAIMNSGNIIELGTKDYIITNPKEVYTRNLFASIPPLKNVPKRLNIMEG